MSQTGEFDSSQAGGGFPGAGEGNRGLRARGSVSLGMKTFRGWTVGTVAELEIQGTSLAGALERWRVVCEWCISDIRWGIGHMLLGNYKQRTSKGKVSCPKSQVKRLLDWLVKRDTATHCLQEITKAQTSEQ